MPESQAIVTSQSHPIFIALGANLPSDHGAPEATLEAALAAIRAAGVTVEARSAWYATAPVPRSGQPDYVNGVARVSTDLAPADLLAVLHRIEDRFGRMRAARNEARVIDLDLIDYGGVVTGPDGEGLVLPHPRAHLRGFVLLPLRDVAPDWRHPVTGDSIDALIGDLSDLNDVRRL
jgi:2-amino-4-hydroxy-6-hydroxymethyldihydropteridine diphosphokinase